MTIRPKSKIVTSAGEIGQLQFNEQAYAQRNVSVGGVFDILGPAGAALRVGMFAAVMVSNTDAAGHYVTFGPTGAVAAPTGLTDGIYIPPYSNVFLSSGQNSYIIADSATVGVYKMQDSVVAQDQGN